MIWHLEFRPEVAIDIQEAANWYESREPGLGSEFINEIIDVCGQISKYPLIGSRRDLNLDIRWRYPQRFPYRVIYRVDEVAHHILVIAVLHAARNDQRWRLRTI